MPSIDFYVLNTDAVSARDKLLVSLCERAVAKHHHVAIWVTDVGEAQRLDEWLWTYDDMRFLAHTRQSKLASFVPITLFTNEPIAAHTDILINLNAEVPQFNLPFNRILHLVQPNTRDCSREHYRYYQQQGFSIRTHQL